MKNEVSMDAYQSFIHRSRYARYLPELDRRENWEETVDRYVNYIRESMKTRYKFDSPELFIKLRSAIVNMEVLPSMRAMMTAGKAADRDNTCIYNCAFLPVDDPKAFDEAMFILLCGTGVGFSVEQNHVSKLPDIPDVMFESDTKINVRDSKEGWAKALRQLVALLYAGEIPQWDVSRVRPAGETLKTFGGRASGPDPLVELFRFTINIFKNAKGRKLTTIECHDIMCKIAEVVVVGGVRRSAMISLSDLTDDRMRHAKAGAWWEANVQRSLSNNSAVYNETPDIGLFMQEWSSLYESKSGERGIFNRDAAKRVAARSGRRDPNHVWGCNPCCFSGTTWIQTSTGPKMIKDILGVPTTLTVNGSAHKSHTGSWVSGRKKLYRMITNEGFSLECTDDHRIMTTSGWKMLKEIERGDTVVLNEHHGLSWEGKGNFAHGYLLGAFVGDVGDVGQVKVWPKDVGSDGIKNMIAECMQVANIKRRSDAQMWVHHHDYDVLTISKLSTDYGMLPENKHDISMLETCSSDFYLGFLKGLFDADGHVEGSDTKGWTVRLGQNNITLMQTVQRMLLRLGIHSKIRDLHETHMSLLPDGNGGKKEYACQKSYRLIISGGSMHRYAALIGFAHNTKREKLKSIVSNHRHYKKKFHATFEGIEYLGEHDVYDIEVDSNEHAIDANGIVAHNSEIILRPYQLCNLSEVVVRADDTFDSIARKIELATILGTFQSTFTHFPYMRKIWQKNCEEERLLGVSMTGIYDSKLFNNPKDKDLPGRLEKLRQVAVDTNKELAEKLGINPSTAITCTKPAGTTSQLTDSASGIHPRHARYYYRRVRGDNKDPLTQYMIDLGVHHEPDVTKPHHTTVFTFPKKAPKGAMLRSDITATDHLELWLIFQRHWCEHKPSVTINVKEHEWMAVGAWVYEHFDEISGISFLPYDGGTYRQAPYEEVTKEEYEKLLAITPDTLDWSTMIEKSDTTEGAQTLACSSAAGCEL